MLKRDAEGWIVAGCLAYGALFLTTIAVAAIAWGARLALILVLSAMASAFLSLDAQLRASSEHLVRGFIVASWGLGVLAALALLV